MGTSLLVSTGAISCYPASMVNLIWFANEKMLIALALSNMGPARNSTITQYLCADALPCWKLQILSPTNARKRLFWQFMWLQW